jgi:hypothetical protein
VNTSRNQMGVPLESQSSQDDSCFAATVDIFLHLLIPPTKSSEFILVRYLYFPTEMCTFGVTTFGLFAPTLTFVLEYVLLNACDDLLLDDPP